MMLSRSGSRSSSSSSSDYSDSSSSSDPEASHPGWRSALADNRDAADTAAWAAAGKKQKAAAAAANLAAGVGGSSSTDEGDSDDGEQAPRETLTFGLTGEDDEDSDDMDDEDQAFLFGRKSSQPVMTWPPAVAVNSNHPELIAAASNGKKKKPGIIYLSSIPQGFNVSRTTGFFAQYGRVGRVYLQPDAKEKANRKDKLARNFTEGWIEFMSKRLAKEVASNLNLSQVGGKKRSKSHDVTWNIKYLPGFKWTHLSEKLAYEKAVHQQRMRTEISQAKRETDFFKANLEKSKRQEKKKDSKASLKTLPKAEQGATNKKRAYEFRQKETDDAIKYAKKAKLSAKKKSSLPAAVKQEVKTEVKDEPNDDDEEDEEDVSPPKRRRASGPGAEPKPPPPPPPPSKKKQPKKQSSPTGAAAAATKSNKKGGGSKQHNNKKKVPEAAATPNNSKKNRKSRSSTERSELLKSLM